MKWKIVRSDGKSIPANERSEFEEKSDADAQCDYLQAMRDKAEEHAAAVLVGVVPHVAYHVERIEQ